MKKVSTKKGLSDESNGKKLRFEYNVEEEGALSHKFWEPRLDGHILTVCFGRIGFSGRTHKKTFLSVEKAETEYKKLALEKVANGYRPTKTTVANLLANVVPVAEPKVVGVVDISNSFIQDAELCDIVCAYLTTFIQFGMTPSQFDEFVDKMEEEEEDERLKEAVMGEYFFDEAVVFYLLRGLYKTAVENKADRFAWFANSDESRDVVALHGDPGVKAICARIYREYSYEEEDIRIAEEDTSWSEGLGIGLAIASIDCNEAQLWNGEVIR